MARTGLRGEDKEGGTASRDSLMATVTLTKISICLSVYLSVYLSVCLSVCLSICLSIYLSVYLSICLSICLSIYLSVCLSICLSVCLSVCLSILYYVYRAKYFTFTSTLILTNFINILFFPKRQVAFEV